MQPRIRSLLPLLCFSSCILSLPTLAPALPPAAQAELQEPDAQLASVKKSVDFEKRYHGAPEELARLEARFKAIAAAAGVSEQDREIASRLATIGRLRDKATKALAELAKKAEALAPQIAVFEATRADLQGCHDLLESLARTEDRGEFLALAASAEQLFARGQELVATVAASIPRAEVLNFERDHQPASEFRLASILGAIPNLIEKGQQRVATIVPDTIQYVESDVSALGSMDNPAAVMVVAERVKGLFAAAEKARPGDKELLAAKKRLLPKVDAAVAKANKQLAKARLPADQYQGADGAALRATMATLYTARYPGETVKKVVLTSRDWSGQARAIVNNDGKIEAGYYKYLDAAIGVLAKGGAKVYTIGFRKTWQRGTDTYGPLELHSIGASYPILPKHL